MYDFLLLAENWLEKPSGLGVPIGVLLLFWLLMRKLDEKKN